MFEYYFGMINSFGHGSEFRYGSGFRNGSDRQPRREASKEPRSAPATSADGPLQAMSPGVVDYLFRQLVSGNPAEDVQWGREGISLSAQPPGAELARRLSETDLEALTPTELFHYVRAAQRLAAWAESLREAAVGRYCAGKDPA